MEDCAADISKSAVEAVCGKLQGDMDHSADKRALQATIAKLEKRCASLERKRLGEVHIVRFDLATAEGVKEQFDRTYGGHWAGFNQEAAFSYFPMSDQRIGEKALDVLHKWKELYDIYHPGKSLDAQQILNEARARLANQPGVSAKKRLDELLLKLAILSGERKAAWCELVAEREGIDREIQTYATGGKEDPRTEGSLLGAIDRTLKKVEYIRRLHWHELDMLRDEAAELQRGGFNMSESLIRESRRTGEREGGSERVFGKTDNVQEYLFNNILSLYKTFTGRQGFNNRCIQYLDLLRKNLLIQRDQECESRELESWEEEKAVRNSLDEYKATIMRCELEKGVQSGAFQSEATTLFLY